MLPTNSAVRVSLGAVAWAQVCLAQALLSVPPSPVSSGLPKPMNGAVASLDFAVRSPFRLPTDGSMVMAWLWPSQEAPLYASKRGSALSGAR